MLSDLREARSGGQAVWDGKAAISVGAAVGDDVAVIREKLHSISGTVDLPMIYLIKLDE